MNDITIYEVGPRDGLQNSKFTLSTAEKIYMIESLHQGGLENIEVTSFVHPKYVPQMADAEAVFNGTKHIANFDVLIPNKRGYDRAKAIGVENFNVFFSSSDEFNIRNLGRKFNALYPNIKNMLKDEDKENIRAYISCAFGCPFEGSPKEHKLLDIIRKADEIADTIVLCDTIGVSHPTRMHQTLNLTKGIDANIALHLHESAEHNTNILSNVHAAIDWGVTHFDASIAGLGGCPFIPGSGSNLSTNKLINWGYNNGYDAGIELSNLEDITHWILNRQRKIKI